MRTSKYIIILTVIAFSFGIWSLYNQEILTESYESIEFITIEHINYNKGTASLVILQDESRKNLFNILENSKVKTHNFVGHDESIQSEPSFIITIRYKGGNVDKLMNGEGVSDFYRSLENEDYVEVENAEITEFCEKQFQKMRKLRSLIVSFVK